MGSFWRETRNSLLKDRNFRIADKPSGGELITGFERYGDLSPTIGCVLRLHVRESIQ
jgi:hypothetical protein